MEYPGLNVRELSDDKIQKKIAELNNRLSRPNIRGDIAAQMRSLLNTFVSEINDRNFKKNTETDRQWQAGVVLDTDKVNDDKDDLDKLIDIN